MPATHPYHARLRAAARQIDPSPTPAQIEAGNHRLGHVHIHGLNITIETAKGQVRSKIGKDGKRWSRTMKHAYGRIRRTEAADGDHVDVFIGDHPNTEAVYVIDQLKADGSFDESKAMLGFLSADDAKEGYLKHYPKGWKGLGAITPLFMHDFKEWVYSDRAKRPASGKKFEKRADSPLLGPLSRILALITGSDG